MEFTDLFDKKTLNAILADAKEAGIGADDVKKVLNTIHRAIRSAGGAGAPEREVETP